MLADHTSLYPNQGHTAQSGAAILRDALGMVRPQQGRRRRQCSATTREGGEEKEKAREEREKDCLRLPFSHLPHGIASCVKLV